jgi:hypothetical protein
MEEAKEFINSLSVGDEVDVLKYDNYGWNGRIPIFVETKITKITPKRTKFEFEDGGTCERARVFDIFPITEQTKNITKMVLQRRKLRNVIYALQGAYARGQYKSFECLNFKDEDVNRASELLSEVLQMLETPSKEG